MRALSLRLVPCAVASGFLALAAISPAAAVPVTFAQYVQQNGNLQEWSISTNGGGTTTITASGAVFLSFSGVPGLPFVGPESAMFSLSATSSELGNCSISCGPGDSFVQAGYAGSFSFIDTGLAPGTNLLSGTFSVTGTPADSGAQLKSTLGGTGASFAASTNSSNLDQLEFTSDYLTFLNQIQETATFSLSSLIPNFDTGVVLVNQARPANGVFTAAGSGTFSSNPGPGRLVPVPEPTSMLLLGSGLIGAALIRRRAAPATA